MSQRPHAHAGREADRASRIAARNDAFRTGFQLANGLLVRSLHFAYANDAIQRQALDAVRAYDAFTPEDDPHGEHDFGAFTLNGLRLLWKIDVYADSDCLSGCDPLDPAAYRVLTLMFAEDW